MRLEVLAAVSIWLAEATASTVTLPLRSRAREHEARGDAKFRLPGSLQNRRKSSGVRVPVTDWFNRTDNQWYTTFSIGTPPQKLTALFDTGSPDLMLPASNCKTCGTLKLFNPNQSTTFSPLPGTKVQYDFATGADSIPFTTPEGATCHMVHDSVSLGTGALKVDNLEFILCDNFAEALVISGITGIMGMGPPITGGQFLPSWYWTLVNSSKLDSASYSFYIPPGDIHGGEVTLGGVDTAKVEGAIHYQDLNVKITDTFGYAVDQSAMYANGKVLTNTTAAGKVAPLPFGYAILDTGTAFMQVPDYGTAKSIYAQISPNITQIDPAGAWGAPCAELARVAPDLTFTLGTGRQALNLTIPREHFSLGEYPGQPGICQAVFNNPVGSLTSQWFLDGSPVWLIGSPLIDKYYSVWDGIGQKIGWGKLPGLPGF